MGGEIMEKVKWNILHFIEQGKEVNYKILDIQPKEFNDSIQYLIRQGLIGNVTWDPEKSELTSASLSPIAQRNYVQYIRDREHKLGNLFSEEYNYLREQKDLVRGLQGELQTLEDKKAILAKAVIANEEYFAEKLTQVSEQVDSTKRSLDAALTKLKYWEQCIELLKEASESVDF